MSRKNDFYLFFWSGLIMMVVGLFFLSQKVTVTNSFWGGGMRLMGMYINSGIVMVPFIFSLIWLFIKTNMASKVALVLSVILILASLIHQILYSVPVTFWLGSDAGAYFRRYGIYSQEYAYQIIILYKHKRDLSTAFKSLLQYLIIFIISSFKFILYLEYFIYTS